MDKDAIKELIYGGLMELMRDRKHYYHSTVSASYSHWTEAGEKALAEYMNMMGWAMLEAEERELDQRAKSIVMKSLKGDQSQGE
jgi:hypothetical protein